MSDLLGRTDHAEALPGSAELLQRRGERDDLATGMHRRLGDRVRVIDRDERVHRRGQPVGEPRISVVESAAGKRGEITVSGAVHEGLRAVRAATGHRLGDDGLDVPAGRVAVSGDDGTLKRDLHAGLAAHLLAHELHVLGFVDPVALLQLEETHLLAASRRVHRSSDPGGTAARDDHIRIKKIR